MNSEAQHRSKQRWNDNCIMCSNGGHYNNSPGDLEVRGARRTGPLLWPLLGKGQTEAGVRASGCHQFVWRCELSIQALTQQPGIAVTLWVWHSTFALTSWPRSQLQMTGPAQSGHEVGGAVERGWLRDERGDGWGNDGGAKKKKKGQIKREMWEKEDRKAYS